MNPLIICSIKDKGLSTFFKKNKLKDTTKNILSFFEKKILFLFVFKKRKTYFMCLGDLFLFVLKKRKNSL